MKSRAKGKWKNGRRCRRRKEIRRCRWRGERTEDREGEVDEGKGRWREEKWKGW